MHIAGVFASGLLADDKATYAYRHASPEMAERARIWRVLAAAHGHPLPAIAIAFATAPECVERVVLGFATPEPVEEGMRWVRAAARVGTAVWDDAKQRGLLPCWAPTPRW